MLLRRVRETIRRQGLLARGARVLAAVSGGSDSVALLALLRALAPAWRLRLTVAHLDHRLRGAESARDAAFVAALARRWALPCVVGRADVRGRARRRGISLEMAAREARYAFFERTARARGCDVLATAHTADDQAETVLLNLARGAGPAGLAGIPWVGRHGALRVVRPLRGAARAELRAWLRRRRVAWREDASNADPAFLRNRVRHEIIPLLEARLNPAVRRALLRAGEILAAEHAWLGALAEALLDRCRVPARPPRAPAGLDVRPLADAPPAARRRVLRRWLETSGAAPGALGFEAVERLVALLDGPGAGARRSRAVPLPGGWTVRWSGSCLVLAGRAPAPRPAPARAAPLPVPGAVRLSACGGRLRAWVGPGLARERPAGIGAWPARASLSLAAWGRRRLAVRAWRPGDRMRPFGLVGSKKVQDIFGDAKVPRERRSAVPIVVCGGEIVWIPGYRVAAGWAVRPGARRALQLAAEPSAGRPGARLISASSPRPPRGPRP